MFHTVVQAAAERPTPVQWNDRLFDAFPVAPVWVGVGIAIALLAVLFVMASAAGRLAELRALEIPFWASRDARLAVFVVLLAAFLLTARRTLTLGARRDLEDLRPLLREGKEPFESLRRSFMSLDRRTYRTAAAVGLLVMPLTALLVDRQPSIYLQSWYWRPEAIWTWALGLFLGWNLGGFIYAILGYSRRFSHLAGRIRSIDLFDLRPLAPFRRQGLRSVLLVVILLSLSAMNALDRAFAAQIIGLGAFALVTGTLALLLPVRGVRERIRETKNAELARVHAAIRGKTDALGESEIAKRAETVQLADLLAYRAHVQSVREWPFDAPTLLRFALYLAIPIGSWLGGAMVERLLAAALD
jgi:hypothetical protein